MGNEDLGILSLYFLLERAGALEEAGGLYCISWEEQETQELVGFIRRAEEELRRRRVPHGEEGRRPYGAVPLPVRITRGYRIYIGADELKLRPMAKTVLLLFLQHPEGIPLKCIGDHREELAVYYRHCSRSLDPAAIDRSISRILDIFSNDLNVNIARVNAAVDMLAGKASQYRIQGAQGHAKSILLDRSLVVWE